PVAPLEAGARRAGKRVLQRLERGADAVAQRGEPLGGLLPAAGFGQCVAGIAGHRGHVAGRAPVWRNASNSAIAPAWAAVSDRADGRKGITPRAAAASCTSAGTRAVSRPSRIVSPAANANRCSGTLPEVVISTSRESVGRFAR